MREDMSFMDSATPEWVKTGIAFAEIPHSGNYFVFHPTRDGACNVHYADHDSFNDRPWAGSFEAFLGDIVADPAAFMYRAGCYTRYCDGNTKAQWIPKTYVNE